MHAAQRFDAPELTLSLHPNANAWGAWRERADAAFQAFAAHSDLLAVELHIVSGPSGYTVAGAPSAWMDNDGDVVPYMPDTTGERAISRHLWALANNLAPMPLPPTMAATLLPQATHQSALLFPSFVVARDDDAVGDDQAHAFSGCCPAPPVSSDAWHSVATRISGQAHSFAHIVSLDIGSEVRTTHIVAHHPDVTKPLLL